MTIEEKVEEFRENLDLFDDDLGRYDYIIDLGKGLEELPEELKNDATKVQGCVSNVWLVCEEAGGLLKLRADGDAKIVRGLVKMMTDIFSGHTPREVWESGPEVLESLGLSEIITPGRQNGVAGMIKRIRECAYGKL